MKGDFSRFTFDPSKHYDGVLHQQGRVWLDSDWNEDVLERLALLQKQLTDIIGSSGVPSPGTAFQLSPSADPNNPDDFQISAGRCYVQGILCELEGNTGYLRQPDLPDPPRIPIPTDGSTLTALVYLEVWQRLITYLEDDSLREIALGGPDTATRLKTVAQVRVVPIPNAPINLTCAQAAQSLPRNGSGRLTTLQPLVAQPQNLCQLPDPANFTGRENHFYRVEIHDAGDVAGDSSGASFRIGLAANVNAGATSIPLAAALSSSQVTAALRNGFVSIADNTGLSERVSLNAISTTGTVIALGQALQNAYTTANAATVTGGVARFKWSRDNAAFAVGVTSVSLDRTTLTLASLGRDAATALQQGDLVEVSDDASELGPARGHLTQIADGPDPDRFTVVLVDPLPVSFVLAETGTSSPPPTTTQSNRHLVLRRWDGSGDATAAFDDVNTPGMNLGDGVRIQFGGLDLRSGDYWNFAARRADGSVEPLFNAPPDGIARYRAPLAVVSWGPPPKTSPPSSPPAGAAMLIQDCRRIFPSLINFPQVDKGFHVTGLLVVDPAAGPSVGLLNDTNVQVNTFGGIDIQCDDVIDPVSVSRPTCFLTADFPVDISNQGAATGYFRIVLGGKVSAKGSTISWRPLPGTQGLFTQLIAANQTERGILTHLNLKGNFIWSANDPTSFLDAEGFGSSTKGVNAISLSLPSGDKRRGGDLTMWFWIVAAPSVATSMSVVPTQIFVNDTAAVTVTLSSAAPAGSNAALVASSNPAVAPVPAAAIAVPPGATSITFQVTARAVGQTNLTATFPSVGGQTVAATLVVQALPVLTGNLALDPAAIFVDASSVGTVTISGPAPKTGLNVAITSSNVGVATVPATITVASGAVSVSFTIAGLAEGTAVIGASLVGATAAAPLTALLTVRKKPKIKEKEKEKDKEKEKEKDKERVKDVREKVREVGKKTGIREILEQSAFNTFVKNAEMPTGKTVDIAAAAGSRNGNQSSEAAPGLARAFIIPAERPAVEESALNADGE